MGKVEKIADFSPVSGKGRRAHITLGTAKGVSPVQTGFDLLEAVSFEQNASKEKYAMFQVLILKMYQAITCFYLLNTCVGVPLTLCYAHSSLPARA